ncbi:MAG: hypothetical protein JXB17_12280 [Bacteroidales bacterium]|nr:hypothetical protein [Bacteroidales bacterium]
MKSDTKKWIELLAVIITGLLKFIIMDWLQMRAFYIVGVCLFWLIYIVVKYKSDRTLFKHWGFQKNNFRQSFVFLFPVAILSITVIVIYGLLNNTVILNRNIILIFLLYPVFGLFQQFMMIGLIAGNLIAIEKIRFKNYQVVILTSIIFSLVHYPSYFLMVFTFFLELVFTSVYLKWRNLWSLGLYHGWIATFLLFYVLERDLWIELFAWF